MDCILLLLSLNSYKGTYTLLYMGISVAIVCNYEHGIIKLYIYAYIYIYIYKHKHWSIPAHIRYYGMDLTHKKCKISHSTELATSNISLLINFQVASRLLYCYLLCLFYHYTIAMKIHVHVYTPIILFL